MEDSIWKSILAGVAPTLATAIGGPYAGMAVKVIGEKLLGRDDADITEIEEAIKNARPEDLLGLKELDVTFKLQMKKLDIDLEKAHLGDRQDARAMAMANMWPQIVLSVVFIVGFFWVIYIEASMDHVDIDDYLLGVLTGAIPMILQFWFGSSTGSKEKSAKL